MEIGDVVRMKAGGPLMTVAGIFSSKQIVEAWWFDNADHLVKEIFQVSTLEKVDVK